MNALHRIAVWIGGGALLAATLIDTLSVIGRNVGMPIIGSIELVQAAVLVSGIVGIVLATAAGEHAHVRLVIDRMRGGKAIGRVVNALGMALFFAALLAGSVWLAADLWGGHERSELLGVPWAALRMIANIGLAIGIVLALAKLGRRGG